eukprot:gnl/TRDRNA2_/TRDRNA2_185509_c0_seq1.p1 gnl/TRDRNA2_/TRDRNA2_185509_c0~~gnl/TRDRNA2_/TRDRNA2_185509_c0_seq1.p1  ORF type:complete len:503 (-),score=86.99 gnl/TRDRNA2_/TRDRNA2_185509_c0_seq1:88-1596(-)
MGRLLLLVSYAALALAHNATKVRRTRRLRGAKGFVLPQSELKRDDVARHTLMGPVGTGIGSNGYMAFRQTLANHGDAQYTAEISIGNQSVQAIIDTGSFEVLVFSEACRSCGAMALYSKAHSGSYTAGSGLATIHNFGSGDTHSIEGFETVNIGPYDVKNQAFWEVVDAKMQVLEGSAKFNAIVGVGPPNSARKLAVTEAQMAVQQGEMMQRAGMVLPHSMRAQVDATVEMASHAIQTKSLSQNLGMSCFSVCIGRKPNSSGYFIWNDANPANMPFVFTHIPVVGNIHWGVELKDARLGRRTWNQTPEASQLGCGGALGGCGAVVDSGTSLLAAPSAVVAKIDKAMEALNSDCSNLEVLPDLVFNLGGRDLSLPPDSYIATVEGFYTDNPSKTVRRCHSIVTAVDTATQYGPMWILGLPFFRKYYVTFAMGNLDLPNQKRHLYAAEADDDCHPAQHMSVLQTSASFTRRSSSSLRRLTAGQLRLPAWARSAISTPPGATYEL